MLTNISIPLLKKTSTPFTEESRIQAEGQKDGEKNIPQMGSYVSAQFEQALIAHGEQGVQRIYEKASLRIAKLQPIFQACLKRLEELESRLKPISELYETRKKELGRDVSILFPSILHLALILFLAIGEFPLNTVVFRLFGEAEYLTYVMASTLAITIPLLGLFIGIHMRHSLPPLAGNILIGLLTPVAVGSALFAISVLRNTYIFAQVSSTNAVAINQDKLAYALFALNTLVFFAALVSSFFAHDPDEKLDSSHSSLFFLDRKKNAVRKELFRIGTKMNGEIKQAKSQIEQVRALTNERVALYRQTNMRFRSLLPPPTFRKSPEFPELKWWAEVSLNSEMGHPNAG
jgi:tetrahydromethanopterin S-methyltransferase subunit G